MRLDSPHSVRLRLGRLAWAAVEMSVFRFSFHTLSPWRAFLLRCFGARVGRKCRIRRTSHFYYPWNVELGDEVIVGDHANLYSLARIRVGNRATISQESYLCAGTHDPAVLTLPLVVKPIEIGRRGVDLRAGIHRSGDHGGRGSGGRGMWDCCKGCGALDDCRRESGEVHQKAPRIEKTNPPYRHQASDSTMAVSLPVQARRE